VNFERNKARLTVKTSKPKTKPLTLWADAKDSPKLGEEQVRIWKKTSF